jgi:uncharacterized membrane protein YfcA
MRHPALVLFLAAWPRGCESLGLRETGPSLITNDEPVSPVGIGRYDDSEPHPSWGDLDSQGRLGAHCDVSKNAQAQCGLELVCRQSICRHCIEDSECPSLHVCVSSNFAGNKGRSCRLKEAKAWERAVTDPWEALCTFCIFFASALAAAAGTGGGGMFVPLLVSLSSLKAENAVPLSQSMILCGSIINMSVFLSGRHPKFPRMPVIDYDCVVLFEPMLVFGVMTGVMINQMSPQWLLLLLLVITLALALWRTGKKGIQQLMNERKQAAAAPVKPPSSGTLQRSKSQLDGDALDVFVELTNKKGWQVVGIATMWLIMLATTFHGLPPCSSKFLIFLIGLACVLVLCTFIVGTQLRSDNEKIEKGIIVSDNKNPIDWMAGGTLAAYFNYPAVAFTAGFLGGLLGIGGGIIMGPVLVEVGMHSEAVQATSAAFVFLSSSLATIQFARLGQHVWHYTIWYGAVCTLATILGQYLCDEYVRKRGMYSLITLAITGVLAASLIALTIIGTMQVTEDIVLGRQMWFSSEKFCNKAGGAIIAVDVQPETAWPADLH